MTLLTDNLPESLMIFGVLLLIIEIVVLGFSTFILLFFGLSLLISGLVMQFGLIDDTLQNALWINVILTTALAVAFWRPLKRMQGESDNKEVHSDFADHTFTLEADVDPTGSSTYRYSGIEWKLKSREPVSKGTQVQVVKKEVGVLWVEPTGKAG